MLPVVLLLLITAQTVLGDEATVILPKGAIIGAQTLTTTGKEFYAFHSIPFAKPPLDDLRFQPPQPPEAWSETLDLTQPSLTTCFQLSWDTEYESEDCLYLNVFTPQLKPTEPLPVMLYIYGGGFEEGDCLFTNDGPEFLVDNDVIVVTTFYRVGPFGFLATGDMVVPGNMGLKDQQMAMQWVHDNIALFGGDPEKITIFGESAGSASVAYQLLNKKNEGLYRAAIMESGSFLSPWAFQRDPLYFAVQTAKFFDPSWNSTDSLEVLNILIHASGRELDAAAYQVKAQLQNGKTRQLSQGFYYAPVVEPEHDDAFLTEKMYVLLRQGEVVNVPVIIGINSEECLFEAGDANQLKNNLAQYDENLDWLVPDDMEIEDMDAKVEMGKKIREIYCEPNQLFQDNLAGGVKYFSDTSFNRGSIRHAELQANLTDVYFYEYSYHGPMGANGISFPGADQVSHGEETRYIWRTRNGGYDNSDPSSFGEADYTNFLRTQKLFTDFAKFLNPTPEKSDLLQNVTWPKMDQENLQYLNISNDLVVENRPKNERYAGWKALYASLGRDDFDTY